MLNNKYDIVVVGAGHAGLEAAFACANQKLKTLLVTLREDGVAACPCNPSVGGPAKGIVTREIDALGGMQGKAADQNQLQMKLLNSSKGAGVWALRAQVDIIDYHNWFLKEIKKNKDLDLLIDEVEEIVTKNNVIVGVKTKSKGLINTKKVVITTGTYMKALTHVGLQHWESGPNVELNDKKHLIPTNEIRSNKLSDSIKSLGFSLIRLKTGTPPRIKTESIDFSKCEIQAGTNDKLAFEHFNPKYVPIEKQTPCYLSYTNAKTHEIILANIKKSAMYGGTIHGVGPRYCPSIEDKVVRFGDKPRHQLFIEPVSKKLDFMYIQGMSTSLPADVQDQFIRTIAGLENSIFVRYAYAIEYDAIDPTQLYPTLESKKIKGLYFAGQVNGTSGYEEAAGQGMLAGLNAGLSARNKKQLILKREESYIGVMVDDIVTKGITDPYRLLTSRAEHRLYLRDDNADDRLMKYGHYAGTINEKDWKFYNNQIKESKKILDYLKTNKNKKGELLSLVLKRPETRLIDIVPKEKLKNITNQTIKKIEINVKFFGYIKKQEKYIKKISKYDDIDISSIDDFKVVTNLSLEARDKLNKIKPQTLGQAKRIQGINAVDLITIKYYLESKKK